MTLSILTMEQLLGVEAYRAIKYDPSSWEQSAWRSSGKSDRTRCGTKLCWGGHVVALAGGRFLTDSSSSEYFDKLYAEPEDSSSDRLYVEDFVIDYTTVPERLSRLLGLTVNQLGSLVDADNTLEQIRQEMIRKLKVDPETGEAVKPEVERYNYTPSSSCSCRDPFCTLGM